jgi:hypothetical protein
MYSQSLSFVFITFLRSFSKLYQAKKSQEQALMESSEDNKMESILSQLVPRLGACCASDTVKDSKKSNKSSAGLIDFFSSEQCNVSERKPSSFPLLSLDHTNLAGHKRKSKNEVQGQVSNLLLRPVTIDLENEKEFLEEIPGLMLENLYASLDVLVDARINVYSKVLRSHGLALAKCNDAANCSSSGVMAVEYKLETLLEIGTNLSSDSVETKFSVQPNSKATTSDENRLELTIPILLEAFVKDLNIPIPDVAEKAKLPLTFNAPGTITGKCFGCELFSDLELFEDLPAHKTSSCPQAFLIRIFRNFCPFPSTSIVTRSYSIWSNKQLKLYLVLSNSRMTRGLGTCVWLKSWTNLNRVPTTRNASPRNQLSPLSSALFLMSLTRRRSCI